MARFLLIFLVLAAFPGPSPAATPAVPVPPGPLSEALSLVESKKLPEAMKILGSLRPGFDELGPYHYVRALAFSAAGNPQEAAWSYRRAAIYSVAPVVKEAALFRAAETEFGMGCFIETKSDCRIFLKKYPDSRLAGKARILLGRSLSAIGRHREAVREFEQADGSAEALYGKANALQRMGNTGDAVRAYAAAVAADERFPLSSDETRLWMGENLRRTGAREPAKDFLRKVADPANKDYAAFGLAEIAAEESRHDEAVKLFGAVVPSRDRKLGRTALLRISDVEAASGKPREAAGRLQEIVDKYPFTPEYDQAMLRLARLRAKANDPSAALAFYAKLVLRPSTARREALDGIEGILLTGREKGAAHLAALWNAGGRWLLDSTREPALVAIAEALRGSGKPYQDLVRWLSRYGSAPVRPKYLVARSRLHAEAGDVAGLRECLQGLRSLRATGDDVSRAEAYLRYAEKDYPGAADALLSMRRLEEDDLSLLGDVLPYAEELKKAIAAVEAGIARSGAPARVLGRLADILHDEGRRTESIRYYRMAAEKDPENEWPFYRLAVLLGKDGGEEYRKRIRKDPALVRMANAAWKERELDAR
ncbi:MAG: tetratricopeptide repeat protein [Thermodesulfobacteriota bacterium]